MSSQSLNPLLDVWLTWFATRVSRARHASEEIGTSIRSYTGQNSLQKKSAGCCVEARERLNFGPRLNPSPSKDKAMELPNNDGCDGVFPSSVCFALSLDT